MQLDFAVVAFYIISHRWRHLQNHPPWTWNTHITHPDGSVDRIKMDWRNTQGPVLI